MCMKALLEKVMNNICLLTRKQELIDTVSVLCQHCIIGVKLTALCGQVFGLWLIDEQLPLGKQLKTFLSVVCVLGAHWLHYQMPDEG